MSGEPGSVRVKICGLTRPEDARAAVRLGADAVGLVFAPSPRRVTADRAREVLAAARGEAAARGRPVDAFGLFVNAPAGEIRALAGEVGIDVVQLHGDETTEFASSLAPGRLVRAVRVRDDAALDEVRRLAASGLFEAVLLDSYDDRLRGGSGKTFDWGVAARATLIARVILAGGLAPGNVGRAVAAVRPYMVDVSSGVEASPGVKDAELVGRFIEEARAAAVASSS